MEDKKTAIDAHQTVAGDTGNKFDMVKDVVRDEQGNVVQQPGDVEYVRDRSVARTRKPAGVASCS